MKRGLNIGSGQRPFTSTPEVEWCNVDSQERWKPDVCCDAARLPFPDESADYVVMHHFLEHSNLTEAGKMVHQANRVLKPGGSLLIFLPDMKALARRWLEGGISDYIFFVNAMGAWMGHDDDYHRWHYTPETLTEQLNNNGEWSRIALFNWRAIPGADCARDWWILAMEAIK